LPLSLVAVVPWGFLQFIVDVPIDYIWLIMMILVAVWMLWWKWTVDDDEFVNYSIYKRAYPDLSALKAALLMMSSKFRRKSRRVILAYLSSSPNLQRPWALTSAIDPLKPGRVLTGYADGSVRLWDISAGRLLMRRWGPFKAVVSAAFSPDGVYAVTASYDGTARLWNARSGEEMRILRHAGAVNTASFSPDGTRIVTASDDGTARLWDTASGECLVIFHGHSAGVNSAVFSSDGAKVVTGADDCTARIWRTFPTTQTLIDEARRLLAVIKAQDGPVQNSVSRTDSAA
jgi:WD40 repeat protein